MAVLTVHRRNLGIKYKTTVCSSTSLFHCVLAVITFILPFVLAYASQGLWKDVVISREFPTVRFKHQILYLLETSKGTYGWSTDSRYNNLLGTSLRLPIINSREDDTNLDGKANTLHLTIELPMPKDEMVYAFTLLAVFDYKITRQCKATIEGLSVIQHFGGLPISEFEEAGDLTLNQRIYLPSSGEFNDFNISVLPESEDHYLWKINSILENYFNRNLTTHLRNIYQSWSRGASEKFMLTIHINYPEQVTQHISSFWHMLKWAWIQYLSIYIVIAYSVYFIKNWFIRYQVLHTWVEYPKKIE